MQIRIRSRCNAYYPGSRITLWAALVPDAQSEQYSISIQLTDGKQVWWTGRVNGFEYSKILLTADKVYPSVVIVDSFDVSHALPIGVYYALGCDASDKQVGSCKFGIYNRDVAATLLMQQLDQERKRAASIVIDADIKLDVVQNCERWEKAAVLESLRGAWPEKTINAVLSDGSYLVPDLSMVRYLAAITGIQQRQYSGDHDCDDFAFAWVGWMHQPGLSGGSWGYTQGPGHALGIAVTRDAGPVLIEPQTGLLQTPAERRARGWTPSLILM
jgi:hypothetical protein